jgi:hypothetical protein
MTIARILFFRPDRRHHVRAPRVVHSIARTLQARQMRRAEAFAEIEGHAAFIVIDRPIQKSTRFLRSPASAGSQ